MKRALIFGLFVLGCQKHDDSTTTASTNSATTDTVASATPLATIEPVMTASAAPSAIAAMKDAGPTEEDKRRAALAAEPRDGGRGAGDLRLGSGGGALRPGGPGGGLSGIGARDH